MDDGNTMDPFDDLFEAFELEDGPPAKGEEPAAAAPRAKAAEPVTYPSDRIEAPEPAPSVVCTSCGSANPAHNRHCEQCGARVGTGPLPVASAPMIRATAGGRALTVIGGVLLIVLVAVLFLNLRGDGTPPTTSEVASSTTALGPNPTVLLPFDVDASSFFPGFEPGNLIDDEADSYWNDNSLRGNNAWLEFSFAQPVQITEIELQNLKDEEKFRRNYRIKAVVITVDDLQIEIPYQMSDNNQPQRVQIGSLGTTVVRIAIRSTYPAEQYEGGVPFDELALQDVKFFGTTEGGS